MGAYGMVGLGSLLGLGATGMGKQQSSAAASGGTAMVVPKPLAPVEPVASTGDDGRTDNPQMEAARERERQAALLRKQQAPEIFTAGLGASGSANTAKKSLLGG